MKVSGAVLYALSVLCLVIVFVLMISWNMSETTKWRTQAIESQEQLEQVTKERDELKKQVNQFLAKKKVDDYNLNQKIADGVILRFEKEQQAYPKLEAEVEAYKKKLDEQEKPSSQ